MDGEALTTLPILAFKLDDGDHKYVFAPEAFIGIELPSQIDKEGEVILIFGAGKRSTKNVNGSKREIADSETPADSCTVPSLEPRQPQRKVRSKNSQPRRAEALVRKGRRKYKICLMLLMNM